MPSWPASAIRMRNTVGMQMQVQVAVDVVEGQAGGAELLKLRVNFPPQRLAQTALEEIAEPGARRVVG